MAGTEASRGSRLPAYLAEAAGLGLFMVSAAVFTTLLWHPSSPAAGWIPTQWHRRLLMGFAMGGTAMALIYSPWGQRSGAHLNPATTLTFFRLEKIARRDAAFYVLFQFLGGAAGMLLARALLGPALAAPEVHFAVTRPGPWGTAAAFAGEVGITFLLMSVVLRVSNGPFARFTGICAGVLVALYITVEAPLSGMSMNPARTVASALPAGDWHAAWIYFVAPPVGMLLAAEVHARLLRRETFCAKLHHTDRYPCIFRCGHAARPVPVTESFRSSPSEVRS